MTSVRCRDAAIALQVFHELHDLIASMRQHSGSPCGHFVPHPASPINGEDAHRLLSPYPAPFPSKRGTGHCIYYSCVDGKTVTDVKAVVPRGRRFGSVAVTIQTEMCRQRAVLLL